MKQTSLAGKVLLSSITIGAVCVYFLQNQWQSSITLLVLSLLAISALVAFFSGVYWLVMRLGR